MEYTEKKLEGKFYLIKVVKSRFPALTKIIPEESVDNLPPDNGQVLVTLRFVRSATAQKVS